jgi:hypothetical protein
MSSPSPFPQLPPAQLTRDEVSNYLIALRANGHEVFRDREHEHVFVLVLGEDERVDLVTNSINGTCHVQAFKLGENKLVRIAENIRQLDRAVAEAVRACGHEWPSQPTSGRLSAATPATNYRTISQLIGSSNVEAVFDPYLDNSSLINIMNILSFGHGRVSNGVRLLGSTKTTRGPIPRFTRVGVDAWLIQLAINGEARLLPSSPDDHRRFILLSGGNSLILGPSINAIHKNEAAHIEKDADDRTFFDSKWAGATPL